VATNWCHAVGVFFLLDNLIMARKREGGKRERKWQRFGGGRFCGLEIGGSHCDSLVEREEEEKGMAAIKEVSLFSHLF